MPTIFDAAQQDKVDELMQYLANGADINSRCDSGPTPAGNTLFKTIFYVKKALGISCAGLGAMMVLETYLSPVMTTTAFFLSLGVSGASWKIADMGDDWLIPLTYNWHGWTPLHFAAVGNAERAAIYMIENGADYSMTASGKTFLDIAQERGHMAFVTKLRGVIQGRESMLKKINDEKEKAQQTERVLSQVRQENIRLMDTASQLTKDNIALRTQRQEMMCLFKRAPDSNVIPLKSGLTAGHKLHSN